MGGHLAHRKSAAPVAGMRQHGLDAWAKQCATRIFRGPLRILADPAAYAWRCPGLCPHGIRHGVWAGRDLSRRASYRRDPALDRRRRAAVARLEDSERAHAWRHRAGCGAALALLPGGDLSVDQPQGLGDGDQRALAICERTHAGFGSRRLRACVSAGRTYVGKRLGRFRGYLAALVTYPHSAAAIQRRHGGAPDRNRCRVAGCRFSPLMIPCQAARCRGAASG